jgi:hypothetical protein
MDRDVFARPRKRIFDAGFEALTEPHANDGKNFAWSERPQRQRLAAKTRQRRRSLGNIER